MSKFVSDALYFAAVEAWSIERLDGYLRGYGEFYERDHLIDMLDKRSSCWDVQKYITPDTAASGLFPSTA
jgi:hypothetical protein